MVSMVGELVPVQTQADSRRTLTASTSGKGSFQRQMTDYCDRVHPTHRSVFDHAVPRVKAMMLIIVAPQSLEDFYVGRSRAGRLSKEHSRRLLLRFGENFSRDPSPVLDLATQTGPVMIVAFW